MFCNSPQGKSTGNWRRKINWQLHNSFSVSQSFFMSSHIHGVKYDRKKTSTTLWFSKIVCEYFYFTQEKRELNERKNHFILIILRWQEAFVSKNIFFRHMVNRLWRPAYAFQGRQQSLRWSSVKLTRSFIIIFNLTRRLSWERILINVYTPWPKTMPRLPFD